MVRASRRPYVPIPTVARATSTTASRSRPRLPPVIARFALTSARRARRSRARCARRAGRAPSRPAAAPGRRGRRAAARAARRRPPATSRVAGSRANSSGRPASVPERDRRRAQGEPQLRPDERADQQVADDGLLVEGADPGPARGTAHGAAARAGDGDPARGRGHRALTAAAVAAQQAVLELAAVAAADRQHEVADAHRVAAARLDPQLADVRRRDQVGAVHPDEPERRPPLLERGHRRAQQVAALGGVQARVVAGRLDVAHARHRHPAGDAAQLDGDLLLRRRPAAARRGSRPPAGPPRPAGRRAAA